MKTLLLALTTAISLNAAALDMSQEINGLNRDYGQAMGFPIMIFDKQEVRQRLQQKNLLVAGADEQQQAYIIYQYALEKFGVKMDGPDAANLVAYIAGQNNSHASAMPFFKDARKTMKYCAVLPNGVENTHEQEVKRILGALDQEQIFKGFDFNKAYPLMTLEQLKLFSLYHELSHCLDQTYLPSLYEFEIDPHAVHQAESFAEVNALFMLAQRKDMTRLGSSRAILRGLYSKYYGPYLAQSGPSFFGGPAHQRGGSIYFLTIPLLKAQQEVESFQRRVKDLNLQQTLALSREIVKHHAMKSRSFQALHMMFTDGKEATEAHYLKLSRKAPDLFMYPYQDLLYFNSVLDSVEKVLEDRGR